VPHAFSDYHDLLKMADLDAVAICTPPQVADTAGEPTTSEVSTLTHQRSTTAF
jgi:hypothetical protein